MSFIRKILLAVLAVVYFFGMAVQGAPHGGGCHQCGGGGNSQPAVDQEGGLLNLPINLGNRVGS